MVQILIYLQRYVNAPDNQAQLPRQEHPEPSVVPFPDAVSDPRTVMIEFANAPFAFPAVARSDWPLRLKYIKS